MHITSKVHRTCFDHLYIPHGIARCATGLLRRLLVSLVAVSRALPNRAMLDRALSQFNTKIMSFYNIACCELLVNSTSSLHILLFRHMLSFAVIRH